MKIAAVSAKGQEYFYKASTAHEIPKSSGAAIIDALNRAGWQLKPGEVWHMHDCDIYDRAYDFALRQSFRTYKGSVRERRR